MLHESGYNDYCKSFQVYGERPCTISHAALSTLLTLTIGPVTRTYAGVFSTEDHIRI